MHEVQRLEACPQAFAGGMGLSDRLKTLQPLVCSPALRTKSMWVLHSCGDATGLVYDCLRITLLTYVFTLIRMAVPVYRSARRRLSYGARILRGGADLRARGNVWGRTVRRCDPYRVTGKKRTIRVQFQLHARGTAVATWK